MFYQLNKLFIPLAIPPITLTLEDEIDISRGDVIVKSDEQADEANNFDVDIVWLSEDPLIKGKQYFIKRATTTTVGTISQFYYKTDVNTLERSATNTLNLRHLLHFVLKY